MAQLMPLPPTVSCSSKIQIGFTFLVPAHLGSPGQRAVKQMYNPYLSANLQHKISRLCDVCVGTLRPRCRLLLFRVDGGRIQEANLYDK